MHGQVRADGRRMTTEVAGGVGCSHDHASPAVRPNVHAHALIRVRREVARIEEHM